MRAQAQKPEPKVTLGFQRALCFAAALAGGLWLLTGFAGLLPGEKPAPDSESVQRTIEAILSERHDGLRQKLAAFADSEEFRFEPRADPAELREQVQRQLRTAFGRFTLNNGAIVVSADDVIFSGIHAGNFVSQLHLRTLPPLIQSAVRASRGNTAPANRQIAASDEFTSTVLTDGRALYSIAAITLPDWPRGSKLAPMVAAAYQVFGADDLDALGKTIGVHGLRYVAGLPANGQPALLLSAPKGQTGGHLTWDPRRPAKGAVDWVIFFAKVAGGAGLMLFGLAGWRRTGNLPRQVSARPLILSADLDTITQLPTGKDLAELLAHEIERTTRTGDGVSLMMLDIDSFDRFNKVHGRKIGDETILAISTRIARLMRSADHLVRYDGDKFCIIQTGLRSPHDAHALARRVLESMVEELPISVQGIRIGLSIGIAMAPFDASETAPLIECARAALHRAKSEGRFRYAFYDKKLDQDQQKRHAIEDDLRVAIMQEQLTLVYQPIFQSDGTTPVGVECLVRWKHPEKGVISPAEFIPVAEERGLIDALGEWVLRKALQDAKRWPNLSVAVNVSPIQFRKPSFVNRVLQIVDETGFEPWRLELELTEGVIVEDAEAAEQAMMELRAAGIRLALDDFGTGYSSLIYLRRFAFDKIKIDRSFLDALETTGESAILVHSVIHLGRALGLTVTAEGVETSEQHRFLQSAGCHQLQGYLFAKPMPAAQIDALAQLGESVLRRAANG